MSDIFRLRFGPDAELKCHTGIRRDLAVMVKVIPVIVHHMDACVCRFSIPLTVNTSHPLVRRHILIAVIAEIYLSRDLKLWPASSSSVLGVLAHSLSF